MRGIRTHKLLLILSAAVVFVTAYLLILPAFTLDEETAGKQGGIDVLSAEQISEETAAEEQDDADARDAVDEQASSDTDTEENAPESQDLNDDLTEKTDDQPGAVRPETRERSTIEKTVLASDAKSYHITVTCGAGSDIPEGAELEVSELKGEEFEAYLNRTASVMEAAGFSYARIFDIKILDEDGNEIQPSEAVQVSIELMDAESDNGSFSVVHFDDETGEPEQVEAVTDGNQVSFDAESFSAYAIVQGPEAAPVDWERLTSMDEVMSIISDGIYIGHTDGFYMTDIEDVANNNAHGITKTKPAQSFPSSEAVKYYMEAVAGETNRYYIYCLKGGTKYYLQNQSDEHLYLTSDEQNRTAFIVNAESNGRFSIQSTVTNRYLNNWQDANGKVFAFWTAKNAGSYLYLWHHNDAWTGDPYDLDGKSYGLMNWAGGVAGKAMMAKESGNTLEAKALTVMSTANNSSQLFVPNDSDISMWTFHWIDQDKYYMTAVESGSTKYLKITSNGLSLVSSQEEASQIQVVPGTATHAGQICLKSGNTTLTFSGTTAGGFNVGGSVGNEWLNLVELSELTPDYFLTYSATKVGVSDESITNGSRVIVYTRRWNDITLRYDYYAISSDGTLIPVYESGDSIEWVSGQINSLLWNLVEYYWEGTDEPNNYYELYSQYSEQYIAPQTSDGQILSNGTIGINLPGRANGKYYTPILAWDEDSYSYTGLKVEDGRIVTCPKSEAMDFYFAVMQDLNIDDTLYTVNTVDHTLYGITMKIQDYTHATSINGQATSQEQDDVLGTNKYQTGKYTSGLLSTTLGDDGYPVAVESGISLHELYTSATEVNHLFIENTYNASGYFEFDSSQNFASLQGTDFTVYRELGTQDANNNKWSKHGQFLPLNDIEAGRFASVNPENLYTAEGSLLPNSDPRKYEHLYLVTGQPNYYYGVELEASFTQTPNGLDAWGHDIIYEFNGDDDFWLYVDGELVIDLGGIHDAMPGTVNFRTGDVYVNGVHHTLRELFGNNYKTRNPNATDAEIADFLDRYFDEGKTVFRDNTNHTMKIFYMERGAGAANLNMKFNLAAIKKGTVQLSKTLSGVDEGNVLAEFPYQIWYKYKENEDGQELEARLTNSLPQSSQVLDYVFYKDTTTPVKYQKSLEIGGKTYNDVFFLKPGETADISFPEGMTSYRIVECGVNTDVYNGVSVNGTAVEGEPVSGSTNREDYGIDYETTDNRAKVNYSNAVDPAALRTLTIKKLLYDETGDTEIPDSNTEFTFRLYMASEFDDLELADMHTYHIKDREGYYCRWDAQNKAFVRITGDGVVGYSNYADMSDEQKASASFTTSIYGSVGKIKPGYTVEIRDVLAGTKYRVEERPAEIPDGYSFQRYQNYENKDSSETPHAEIGNLNGIPGVNGTAVANVDPNVDVRNLKGWGLRVNKIWSDADYMSDREPTYFAVFIDENHGQGQGHGDGNIELVEGTVRQLPYGADPQTLYWYFDKLADGKGINDYIIREVRLTGNGWTVKEDGTVEGADHSNVHSIHDGGDLRIDGTQKGETASHSFDYTVSYVTGEITADSNVRVDTVTNNRPGIILKKTKWDGTTPLPGSVFELKDDGGNLIGTFTSDSDGMITTAFLRDNVNYTLTETDAPQGWYGLPVPMTIRLNNKDVIVSGPDDHLSDYYIVDNHSATPALTIKNRPYTLQAVKTDGDTNSPLSGVNFALHKQVTVGDVTTIDTNPMPGYETLTTGEDGIIPKIDNTLPAGTYELREKNTPAGYEALAGYIRFTVSETGKIEMIGTEQAPVPDGVTLDGPTATESEDGMMSYVMNVRNYRRMEITLKKTDAVTGDSLNGAKFRLYKFGTSTWEVVDGYDEIDMTEQSSTVLSQLSVGCYRLEEIQAPEGYVILSKHVYFNITVGSGGLKAVLTDEAGTGSNDNSNASIDNAGTVITVSNNAGAPLPNTGGPGTDMIRLLGIMITALTGAGLMIIRRRRYGN